jgi:U3 small nucleolar RNA-associated protein MPP10
VLIHGAQVFFLFYMLSESFFTDFLDQPTRFLNAEKDSNVYETYLSAAELFFKEATKNDPENLAVLNELVTEGFDSNQIWEQIQLLNENAIQYLHTWIDEHGVKQEAEESENEYDKMLETEEVDSQEDQEMDQDFEEDLPMEELEEYEESLSEKEESKPKKSIVDDEFFSLAEMEKFADMAEKRDIQMAKGDIEDDDDENNIFSIGKGSLLTHVDLATGEFDFDLEEEDDAENANDIRYSDFFEPPEKQEKKRKSWKDDMDDEEMEDEVSANGENDLPQDMNESKSLFDDDEEIPDAEKLSKFEREQLRMQKEIERLEAENMAEKEWTMKGEVSSKARPKNSLLEEDLDVDIAAKPVPVITEETTKTLEELIIQRIKDSAFDDVIRKAPIKNSVYDPNRRFELNDEKSKKSLAEIYEEEYQKTQHTVKTEKDKALEKQHQEIEDLFEELRDHLDALSNFHYQPKARTLELAVIPSATTSAIALEEVIPAHVSNSQLAAPKEVYQGQPGKSQEELESSEKTKLRQKAKRKMRAEKKRREQAKDKTKISDGQITKNMAMKKLLGQKNVTLVVDPRKKADKKGAAKTVGYGEKISEKQNNVRPEMLKL